MRIVGIEPTWYHYRRILNPVRLPVPPYPHLNLVYNNIINCKNQVFSLVFFNYKFDRLLIKSLHESNSKQEAWKSRPGRSFLVIQKGSSTTKRWTILISSTYISYSPTYCLVSILGSHCKPALESASHLEISAYDRLRGTYSNQNPQSTLLSVVCYSNYRLSLDTNVQI